MAVDIRDKRLEQAMIDVIKFSKPGQWMVIIVDSGRVSVEYGVIHSNGQEERALG